MSDLTPIELAVLKLFAQRLYDDPSTPPLTYGEILRSGLADRATLRDAFRRLSERHWVFCGASVQWTDDSPCVLTGEGMDYARRLLDEHNPGPSDESGTG